jgi:hypothetical protein
MKKQLAIALIIALGSFCSCRREFTIPPPPGDSTANDINVNIYYYDDIDQGQDQWELIINEPSGKLLLDTVAPANTTIKAHLQTTSRLVNVSTVIYDASYNFYTALTYRNVNPRSWTGLPFPGNTLVPVDTLTSTTATAYYTHPPYLSNPNGGYNYIWMSDYIASGGVNTVDYEPAYPAYQPGGLLTLNYQRHLNNPVYLLFPQLGLYNFHQPPVSGNDTVDLSHIDTAVMINYSLPSSFSPQSAWLMGYADTADPTKSMTLYNNFFDGSLPVDVEFPSRGIPACQLIFSAGNAATNEYLTYDGYVSHPASSINWLTAADYTLRSNAQDSFAVSFGSQTPSIYTMNWIAGPVYYEIYSAPDGATLHPFTWFSHLGSKLLQNQPLTSLTPWYFSFQQNTGIPSDFTGLLNFYAVPHPNKAPLGTTITGYQLTF